MYTGIIEHVGKVRSIEDYGEGIKLTVEVPSIFQNAFIGASIAIDGVCLTVVKHIEGAILFDVMRITVEKTTLGDLKVKDVVHVESSMKLGDEIGGHMIYGHVNGVTEVVEIAKNEDSWLVWFATPEVLADYIVLEGAITLSGVSLTVARKEDRRFAVSFVPHTIEVTQFSEFKIGSKVNVEVDMIAKYAIDAVKTWSKSLNK